ncbi:MAG: hypothetical protein KatS3mg033_1116 [Thermonema sp.]|jgi:gas vesicle protein|uniref:YtxH domain-containing protein n=1 Tax=Thermonema TaxID=28194 RepID=UPI00068B1741|nr:MULTISPECIES: YtxH domain-containing protein [Thermonema]GIV39316.1 MAG: hypothetical protein KatS3mg033_1116 [Thermonema sp.]
MSKTTSLLVSFLAGATVGFMAGILVAPYSGSETRRRLKNKAKDLQYDLQEQVNQLSHKVTELAEKYTPASKK